MTSQAYSPTASFTVTSQACPSTASFTVTSQAYSPTARVIEAQKRALDRAKIMALATSLASSIKTSAFTNPPI